MLAYVGPESIAPVASAIAAVVGFLLIGWRWVVTQCKRVFRFVFRIKVDETLDQSDGSSDGLRENDQHVQENG